jgi:hypothetical protein
MFTKPERKAAADASGRLYIYLLSDAYRELREAEVRWECYAASQYHFDDGVTFALEAVGNDVPVDHPVWTAYSEKVAEVGARVAKADDRRLEKLSVLKGVQQGFLRFCRTRQLDPSQVAGVDRALPAHVLKALTDGGITPDAETAEETFALLMQEWDKHVAVENTR